MSDPEQVIRTAKEIRGFATALINHLNMIASYYPKIRSDPNFIIILSDPMIGSLNSFLMYDDETILNFFESNKFVRDSIIKNTNYYINNKDRFINDLNSAIDKYMKDMSKGGQVARHWTEIKKDKAREAQYTREQEEKARISRQILKEVTESLKKMEQQQQQQQQQQQPQLQQPQLQQPQQQNRRMITMLSYTLIIIILVLVIYLFRKNLGLTKNLLKAKK